METEKPFKEGHLLFPPHGVLGQLKKSWHKKYCQLFKSSKHGIERLEVFDNEEEVSKNTTIRIITLENCIKIMQDAQKHQPNVFVIVTKSASHHFASLTEREMSDWISAFQSIAFKDDCSRHTIEEDNDLYCSSGEGVFTVNLVPSEASTRCKLEPGPYTLVIASAAIQLRDTQDHRLLFTWPYRYIRRYGYREGKFTFEAGRKCDTGEGTFHLEHSNQQEIFRCLSSKMKSMRKLLNGETPSSVGIVCGEKQFEAALSMEARSRSPLPPSPTSATPLLNIDFSAMSQSSIKPLISPIIDTKPIINNNTPPLIKPKPRPSKPPRKHIQPTSPLKKLPDAEDLGFDFGGIGRYRKLKNSDNLPIAGVPSVTTPVSENPKPLAYDKVEVRKEAWRTMGVTELTHTERQYVGSDTEEETDYEELAPKSEPENDKSPKPPCSKILLTQISSKSESMEDYDKLQHFGSSSKLNNNPGYRHIPPAGAPPPVPAADRATASVDLIACWNEYDVIDDKMQACRMADDSHHGYGMIRKKSTPNAQDDLGPNHKVYNELEYAVVHKPKRV
ncbi:docking protein 2 [Periplaneta americana]|uniref:docking protein 2 n=1 Tax=Periplaneta americana TaxID=6978 RepID=UPI0037E7AD71